MRLFLLVPWLALSCTPSRAPHELALQVAALGPLEPLTPDVHLSYTSLVKGLVFQQVLVPGTDNAWRSAVLERWERVAPRRYLLRLKAGLRFSDGALATEEDLATALRGFGFDVKASASGLLAEPRDPGMTPEGIFLRAALFKRTSLGLLGTGPFHIRHQSAKDLELQRATLAPGKVNTVRLVSYPSPRDAFSAALQGEVNFVIMPDTGEMELLEGVPSLKLVEGGGLHALSAVFNSQRLSAQDRRALAEALPVADIARAFDPTCRLEPGFVPTARLPPGPSLRIAFANFVPGMLRAGLALRRSLGGRAGELRELSLPELAQAQTEGDYDVVLEMLQVSPRPALLATWDSGASSNWSHYSNPAFDQALRAGELDAAERALSASPPARLICRVGRRAAVDRRLSGVQLGAYDMLETLPDWQVSP